MRAYDNTNPPDDHYSHLSKQTYISKTNERKSKFFKKRLKDNQVDILEKLPCSFWGVDDIGEMVVEGTNKLRQEMLHAQSIQ
tara:strand:- start:264 stop:509 length:246 start_codon:yes stop_codon:yes gene_type:complete